MKRPDADMIAESEVRQVIPGELDVPGEFCPLGLTLPEGLPFGQWQTIVAELGATTEACMWWLGDALAYGERKYGEMYKQALTSGYDYQTLRNLAWVSSRIELSRRRDKLSWSHHLAVAALTPDQQDALLRRAEAEQMSRRNLRNAVHELKNGQPYLHPSPTPTSAGLARRTAQIRSDKSLAHWIWKTSLAFEAKGALSSSADRMWAQMNSVMRADVHRISRRLVPWFEDILAERDSVELDRSAAAPRDGRLGSECLLTRHGARRIEDYFGLVKVRRFLTALAVEPFTTALLFAGPPGVGKTSMAHAFANEVPAEMHHIPAKACDLQRLERLYNECEYVPHRNWKPARAHVFIIDEADQMSAGAQVGFLSGLDGTRRFLNTVIFIFTTNDEAKLDERFLQRCQAFQFTSEGIAGDLERRLQQIWNAEGGDPASAPDFANIVRGCKANVRVAFNQLERELLNAKSVGFGARRPALGAGGAHEPARSERQSPL